jgi:hypothetical protein
MGAAETKQDVPGTNLVVLTEARLREIVSDAVREVIGGATQPSEGYLDTEQAAAYLGTTVSAIRMAVARGNIVPDHRGRRGGGMRGNRFTRETLDAYCKRRR